MLVESMFLPEFSTRTSRISRLNFLEISDQESLQPNPRYSSDRLSKSNDRRSACANNGNRVALCVRFVCSRVSVLSSPCGNLWKFLEHHVLHFNAMDPYVGLPLAHSSSRTDHWANKMGIDSLLTRTCLARLFNFSQFGPPKREVSQNLVFKISR